MAEKAIVPMKRCNKGDKCLNADGCLQPLTNFSNRKQSPDGHTYTCKECEKQQAKNSYAQRKTMGKIKQTPEEHEAKKQFYRDYYKDNKGRRKEYDKNYRGTEEGRKALFDGHSRRKTRQKSQAGAPYERWQVIEKCTENGILICGLCKQPIERVRDMQLDHIVPISQGGIDDLKNVRCVHTSCNLTRPKDASEV